VRRGVDFAVSTMSNADVVAAFNAAVPRRYVKSQVTAGQSIPNNADTLIAWNAEITDVTGWHDDIVNNTRFTCPSDGLSDGDYLIIVNNYFDPNAVGSRTCTARVNGNVALRQGYDSVPIGVAAQGSYFISSFVIPMVGGDYVEILVSQVSGGPLLWGTANSFEAEIDIIRLR